MPSGYCKERGRTGGLRSIRLTLPSSRHPSHVRQVSIVHSYHHYIVKEWIVWTPCIIIIKYLQDPGFPLATARPRQ